MNRIVEPGQRSGSVRIPASKSQAHRLLICAALGEEQTEIRCDGISADIAATIDCLNALGAMIACKGERVTVDPIREVPGGLRELPCGESGSTLRFLLPLCGALGAEAVFLMQGRLPARPLSPLDAVLREHGMTIRQEGDRLFCSGKLTPGEYSLPGNVSSQYISGLLMALPLLEGESRLQVNGPVASAGYIAMTEDALNLAELRFQKEGWRYRIPGHQRSCMPASLSVEGDWSNAAFFLAAGALSETGVRVCGMNPASSQGDRAVLEILRRFGAEITLENNEITIHRGVLHAADIDAEPIPDLIPVLSVVAACAEGETRIRNAGRLRLKESDRLQSTAALLTALGGDVTEGADSLTIRGRRSLKCGTVDSFGDHRISMAAAVASCLCDAPVTVLGSESVRKSYPRFWDDWEGLTV